MTEEQRQEREDWEALIGSDGWRRLIAVVEREWTSGEAFKRRAIAAAAQVEAGDAVRQLIAASQAVAAMMKHPSERLRVLSQPEPQPDQFKGVRRVP